MKRFPCIAAALTVIVLTSAAVTSLEARMNGNHGGHHETLIAPTLEPLMTPARDPLERIRFQCDSERHDVIAPRLEKMC